MRRPISREARSNSSVRALVAAVMIGLWAGAGAGAAAAAVGEFRLFSAGLNGGSSPSEITAGPDGNVWFADEGTTPAIGRITPAGAITEFSAGLPAGSHPHDIALGSDGNLWFTDRGATPAIGRITPGGAVTEFSAGLPPNSRPDAIAPGPDGNVWFTDLGTLRVGRVDGAGTITQFSMGINAGVPGSVAPGADGFVWYTDVFTDDGLKAIGRMAPATGAAKENIVGQFNTPVGIAPGADGNMWFGERGPAPSIGRITPTGQIARFATGLAAGSAPTAIAPAADGGLWFVDVSGARGLGQITLNGAITMFPATPGLTGIAPGPDGDLWFTDAGGAIGRVATGPSAASDAAPAVSGVPQRGAQLVCAGDGWATWAGSQPSRSAFGFDGYRWLRDGAELAERGERHVATAADVGHRLSCRSIVTYPLLDVTAVATSSDVLIGVARPSLSRARMTPRRFRVGPQATALAAARRAPRGTTFSFMLSDAARLKIAFTRTRPGVRRGGRCVAPRGRRRVTGQRCTRAVALGSLRRERAAGAGSVRFSGRLGRNALAVGSYTAVLSATNAAGRSERVTLRFAVVR